MSSRAKRYCAIWIETTSGSGLGLIRIGSGLDECAFSVDALKCWIQSGSMRIECPMWTGLYTHLAIMYMYTFGELRGDLHSLSQGFKREKSGHKRQLAMLACSYIG